jgi:hypothetical protein
MGTHQGVKLREDCQIPITASRMFVWPTTNKYYPTWQKTTKFQISPSTPTWLTYWRKVYRFLWGGRAPRTDHTNIRGSHHEYDDENRQRSPIVTDDELKDGDFFHAANGIIEEHYFNSGVSNIIESFESAVKMVILEPGMEFGFLYKIH